MMHEGHGDVKYEEERLSFFLVRACARFYAHSDTSKDSLWREENGAFCIRLERVDITRRVMYSFALRIKDKQ